MNQTRWLSPASLGFLPKRIYSFIWGNQYCHPYCSAMQLTQLKRTMLKARLLVYLSWERPFTKMLYTIKVSAVTFLLSYSSFTCTLNFGDGFCTTERWKAVLCVLIISDDQMVTSCCSTWKHQLFPEWPVVQKKNSCWWNEAVCFTFSFTLHFQHHTMHKSWFIAKCLQPTVNRIWKLHNFKD